MKDSIEDYEIIDETNINDIPLKEYLKRVFKLEHSIYSAKCTYKNALEEID